MSEFLNCEAAYDYNTLGCWYQDSLLNPNSPPVWTDEHLMELLNDFYLIPKDTPIADVAKVKHGEWKMRGFDSACSECGYINQADTGTRVRCDYPYCPRCGAKMCGKHIKISERKTGGRR